MKEIILNTLKDRRTFFFLFIINISIGLVIFYISGKTQFPDEKGYWAMSEGLLQGKFSSWHQLSTYYPETLRTPGYPIFIALCQFFFKSEMFVKTVQFFLYICSVFLYSKIIKKINPDIIYRNLFLLTLIPNIQIVYYTGLISAEMLNVFFIALSIYILFMPKTLLNGVLLGICCYLSFIVRPAFLLFPLCICIYFLWDFKKKWPYVISFSTTYLALLIPFGLWNLKNHGIFKVTTVEGGAGVAHLGYWQMKLPDGYCSKFYWPNDIRSDLTKPRLFSTAQELENLKTYEKEWKEIQLGLASLESKDDSSALNYMNQTDAGIFPLHNSKYTLEREKLLWKYTQTHIKEDFGYYVKSRIYHFFKSYVTSLNYTEYHKAHTLSGKMSIVYPFIITFTCIFLGMLWATYAILSSKIQFENRYLILTLVWYYGIVHIPFSMQARYTVPAHLPIILLLSVCLLQISKYKSAIEENHL